jgi:hypothetical protein
MARVSKGSGPAAGRGRRARKTNGRRHRSTRSVAPSGFTYLEATLRLSRMGSRQVQIVRIAAITFLLALTCVPAINMATIVASTGADNLSNDYVSYVGIISRILDGTYNWQNYLVDTRFGPHSYAFFFLIRIALAKFAHWNIYGELYISLVFAGLKLLLLCDAFTHVRKNPARWLVWPLLSALIFSLSQINDFTFGDAGLAIECGQFGVALAAWGIIRFPGTWRAVVLVILGASVASLSGRGGPLAFPVSLVALYATGFRDLRQYAGLIAGGFLATLPYTIPIMHGSPSTLGQPVSLFDVHYLVAAIGFPFSQSLSVSTAEHVGTVGVILLLSGLALLWSKREAALIPAIPSLMVMAYGLLNMWVNSIYRAHGTVGLAPWYTGDFMFFWTGLLGLGYVLWVPRPVRPANHRSWWERIAPLWSVGLVAVTVVVYARSNVTYADKVMYLYARSPSSASCLRNYASAPTYCEGFLFQWGVGNPSFLPALAKPLQAHHLSVFAPDEEWTLQGDYVLDTVRVDDAPGVPVATWSSDLSTHAMPFYDYHHLNLLLPAPDAVSWTVSLPSNVMQARFYSAIATSTDTVASASSAKVRFEVSLTTRGTSAHTVFDRVLRGTEHDWQTFSISLGGYAGKVVTLRLMSANSHTTHALWPMYQYPRIDLTLDPSRPSKAAATGSFVPLRTPRDRALNPAQESLWKTVNMRGIAAGSPGPAAWTISNGDEMNLTEPIDLCLADFTHLTVRMAAPPQILPRAMFIRPTLDRTPPFFGGVSFSPQIAPPMIPLRADGGMHSYTYDLKLLQAPADTRLQGLALEPIQGPVPPQGNQVRIAYIRFTRGLRARSLCR